jgi:hypothetical protein
MYHSTSTGYPSSPYGQGFGNLSAGYAGSGGHSRAASIGTFDVAKHMDPTKGERERKVSIGGTRVYGSDDGVSYERPRTISGSLSDRSNQYPSHRTPIPPLVHTGVQEVNTHLRLRTFDHATLHMEGWIDRLSFVQPFFVAKSFCVWSSRRISTWPYFI